MLVGKRIDGLPLKKRSEQLQLVSPTGGMGELTVLEQPKDHSATATS